MTSDTSRPLDPGRIPILASEQRLLDEASREEDRKEDRKVEGSGRQKVLADGTFDDLTNDRPKANAFRAGSMLIMASIIHNRQSKFVTASLRRPRYLLEGHESGMLQDARHSGEKAAEKKESESTKEHVVQVDDLLTFRQFSEKSADDPIDYVENLGKKTGAAEIREDFISNLSRISQLTGFSDPIYAEAYVKSILCLNVLLVNQTSNTLQNLFATLGDLKLGIKATIKVSSTGVIFGSILWDGPALAEWCVILNDIDIDIDILDYIKPACCSETQVYL
ncbi:coatomer beta C-terminal region-domain-containing protein [Suillus subalutaceus]|uniref:coatomer beta C-terminal region-domain-containing protein n=1 Tax=Suillus subalutaceus TaxID=48586 RepID=UPI001B86AD62|nr:coatomer beta C-terminal region-domain-containing protein [Suillus subalutaceus]KAG1829048.1 coatomer beta C-terminal region-domain-containing protein [Suillus subalutaceus]